MPPEGASDLDGQIKRYLLLIPLSFVFCNVLSWFPAILCYGLARVSAGVFGNEGMNLHGYRICVKRLFIFPAERNFLPLLSQSWVMGRSTTDWMAVLIMLVLR